MVRRVVSHGDVRVHRGAVVVVRVAVIGVRMYVLQPRRRGDRQQGHGDDG